MHNLIMAKLAVAAASVKTLFAPTVIGGSLTLGAILGTAEGIIGEGTGIAIGFVGGMIVMAATGAWFIRGFIDDMKGEIKLLKHDNARMKKKLELD